jgi:hypothetical protein
MDAVAAKDPAAFGQALHSYQDYFADTLAGFTAAPGDVASVVANCPECFTKLDFATIWERAWLTGHTGANFDVDDYDPGDPYATAMRQGTLRYLIMFFLSYYEIDMTYEEFIASQEPPTEHEW